MIKGLQEHHNHLAQLTTQMFPICLPTLSFKMFQTQDTIMIIVTYLPIEHK
jgi:hypothetical protein